MQLPVPLVIVMVADPLPPMVTLHAPAVVIDTGRPELAVADTVKLLLLKAEGGAWVETVIVRLLTGVQSARLCCRERDRQHGQ